QTAASQMPIITSGQTGIMINKNEQRVDQEGDKSITNDNASYFGCPDKKCQLKEIYIWIANTYPFYKIENEGWKNAIRHNLTLCPAFHRCERDDGKRRKKSWAIPNEYQECFINGVYINYKASEIKVREESAAFGSGTINSSSNGMVETRSELIFLHDCPNLSTSPTQSISGFGSILRPAPRQSGIEYYTIMRHMQENPCLNAT
ncbi:7726_t:CDS:2, partial [Diversispora eburnea]